MYPSMPDAETGNFDFLAPTHLTYQYQNMRPPSKPRIIDSLSSAMMLYLTLRRTPRPQSANLRTPTPDVSSLFDKAEILH